MNNLKKVILLTALIGIAGTNVHAMQVQKSSTNKTLKILGNVFKPIFAAVSGYFTVKGFIALGSIAAENPFTSIVVGTAAIATAVLGKYLLSSAKKQTTFAEILQQMRTDAPFRTQMMRIIAANRGGDDARAAHLRRRGY